MIDNNRTYWGCDDLTSKIHKYIIWLYLKSQRNGKKSKKCLKIYRETFVYIIHFPSHHFPKIRRTLLLNYLVRPREMSETTRIIIHCIYFFTAKPFRKGYFYSIRSVLNSTRCTAYCSVNKIKNVVPFRFLIFFLQSYKSLVKSYVWVSMVLFLGLRAT